MRDSDWAVIDGAEDIELDVPEDVVAALYTLKDAIFRYPTVMQAVFSALVAEGRSFAETEEGAELLERLVRSPSSAGARLIWELMTMNAFAERPDFVLPSAFVDRLVRAISIRGIEPLVSRLFEKRAR